MRGGISGRGLRGGLGGVDSVSFPGPYQLFGKSDGTTSGHRRKRCYVAGASGECETRPAGGTTLENDRAFAFPAWIAVDCSVTFAIIKRGSGNTTGNFRLGLYANLSHGDVYPGDKLWQSANHNAPDTFNALVEDPVANVVISGGSLIWVVAFGDANAINLSVRAMNARGLLCYGGFPTEQLAGADTDPDYAYIVGWKHAHDYNAGDDLPSTFPSSGPTMLKSHSSGTLVSTHPALMYSLAIG